MKDFDEVGYEDAFCSRCYGHGTRIYSLNVNVRRTCDECCGTGRTPIPTAENKKGMR